MVNWRNESDYVVFDLEIKKRIEELPNGWKDHHLMGVSSGVAWSNREGRIMIFDDHNIDDLLRLLASAPLVVGFNHIRFDYPVLLGATGVSKLPRPVIAANGHVNVDVWPAVTDGVNGVKTDFDLLIEVWRNMDCGPCFNPSTHGGYGLDSICELTLGRGKSGDGAHAPVLYQQGRWAELIDYNIQDVVLTRDLFRWAQEHGFVLTKTGPVFLTDPLIVHHG